MTEILSSELFTSDITQFDPQKLSDQSCTSVPDLELEQRSMKKLLLALLCLGSEPTLLGELSWKVFHNPWATND